MPDFQLETPVAFFVFNRPDTTLQVFEQIRQAKPAHLLIVADAPRPEQAGEAEKCAQVRAIVANVDWVCQVSTNFAEQNMGCRRRIKSGIDWVFSEVEEAIILEDDCLPQLDFFRFCQDMLMRYRTNDQVMMVTGDNFLTGQFPVEESYFFSRFFAIWGWATWRRAWELYDEAMQQWPAQRQKNLLAPIFQSKAHASYFETLFDTAYARTLDTWDLNWFYTCFFNNALCITPTNNLVSNIGIVGTHHSQFDSRQHMLPIYSLYESALIHPERIVINKEYDDLLFEKVLHYTKAQKIYRRFLNRIKLSPNTYFNKQ